MPLAGEPLELLDAALGIVAARDGVQIVAYELIEALAEGLCLPSGASYELLVNGERDVH